MVKIGTCLKWFFIGLVVLFIYAPIVLLTVNSFNASDRIQIWDGFSLEHYKYFFDFDHEPLPIVLQTLALAAVVATLSTLLGTVGAIGIFYSKKKVAGALSGVNRIPVINAEVVTAISFALLVTALNVDKSTYIPLILGQMVLCTPFVVLSVMPKLKQMDSNTYEAALDLGASPTQALFKVVLPQIFSGVVSGFMLSITLSLDDYIVTAFTKPPMFDTISTYVYNAVKNGTNNSTPALRALSALIFVVMIAVLLVINLRARKPQAEKGARK